MKAFQDLIRTLVDIVLLATCLDIRIHCEIVLHNNSVTSTNENSDVSEMNINRTDLSTDSTKLHLKDNNYNGKMYHYNNSGKIDREIGSNHLYISKPEFLTVSGETLPVSNYEVTTSVTLSTLSSSLSKLSPNKIDSKSSLPYSYSSTVNSSLARQRQMEQNQPAGNAKLDILVGVLLPFSGNRPFVIKKVAPAIEKAVDKITLEMGPWNFNSLTVLYADSKCDIAEAMNQAIQFQERQKTSAFFGPVCDYAIAPVARQARYWNTPIITVGATAIDFYWYKNTTYATLTRVGPANLQGYTEFVELLITRHRWGKFKVLYDSTGHDDSLFAFSHLLVEYLHYHLISVNSPIKMDFYKLDRGASEDPGYVMRREVSTDYSGITSATVHEFRSTGVGS